MPTFEEVIMLGLDAPKMQFHIEMKGPALTKEAIARYDYYLATKLTRDLIDKYELNGRSIITSFDPLIISNIEKVKKQRKIAQDFKICHLVNRYMKPSIIGYQTPRRLDGILIWYNDERYLFAVGIATDVSLMTCDEIQSADKEFQGLLFNSNKEQNYNYFKFGDGNCIRRRVFLITKHPFLYGNLNDIFDGNSTDAKSRQSIDCSLILKTMNHRKAMETTGKSKNILTESVFMFNIEENS